ncbi:MAG: shikimate dehydrogenase [Candidatus Eremiobacteraeota bacterium]|nr:shikimate dehydrogenase [Candidatus Eremiobacteraeota bacterium]
MQRPARYALIGDPVSHSLSPRMYAAAFRACGLNASYEAIEVPPDAAAAAIRRLRAEDYAGFNVTTPLKQLAAPLCDALTETAKATGAVNTIRSRRAGLCGHLTDGAGLVRALRDLWGWQATNRKVLILGSGPAARAAGQALKLEGAVRIDCWSRNQTTASLIGTAPSVAPDLVVSALPPAAQAPSEVLNLIRPDTLIFDLNYGARGSPIPPGVGGRRSDGIPLLLHQGALAFEWWTGMKAPLRQMQAALEH